MKIKAFAICMVCVLMTSIMSSTTYAADKMVAQADMYTEYINSGKWYNDTEYGDQANGITVDFFDLDGDSNYELLVKPQFPNEQILMLLYTIKDGKITLVSEGYNLDVTRHTNLISISLDNKTGRYVIKSESEFDLYGGNSYGSDNRTIYYSFNKGVMTPITQFDKISSYADQGKSGFVDIYNAANGAKFNKNLVYEGESEFGKTFMAYSLNNVMSTKKEYNKALTRFTDSIDIKTAFRNIRVALDSRYVEFEQQPVMRDGRILVPMRVIFESMGASVSWNQKTQTVTAVRTTSTGIKDTVEMKIGSKSIIKNGKSISVDVSAQVINGSTLVPVRAIAEAFGASVSWDNVNSIVEIQSEN
ncbi:copper amine oxidase N-terminal domain-containing protein [Paenibacillus sp. ACRSA]|uniref:stalk domain-containing protein n=1 Tax=Paenibacillus sp. ACRSA TaxID=2918211 RepID=UPI001EF43FA7|nr:stalk domain-containing protein [Paenibacillus sp. ACRSA]MCG7377376.1 copper amine oxidase N-terminal domain-containing protein [Paenibacillus sp. ACRSA]